MSRIYLVCPVRDCSPHLLEVLRKYVDSQEALGHTVHFPHRDVDQSNDDGAVRICTEHLDAILACDEVHIWFDENSFGCHFDCGMSVILHKLRGVRLVAVNGLGRREHKSFANFLRSLIDEQLEKEEPKSGTGLGKQVPFNPEDDCC